MIISIKNGFVELVDVMGSDASICRAARVSTGDRSDGDSGDAAGDRKLINYLMSGAYENKVSHTSPFEMAEMIFRIKAPIFVFRQLMRHRTAHVNEYSQRYTEAIDECWTVESNEWRFGADASNKQGSAMGNLDLETGTIISNNQESIQYNARREYKDRLSRGVSREQARIDLPLSVYSVVYWKQDLHNLLKLILSRGDHHAQLETRLYSNAIEQMIKDHFPITYNAWVAHVRDAITFSVKEQNIFHMLLNERDEDVVNLVSKWPRRQREAFLKKLDKLNDPN